MVACALFFSLFILGIGDDERLLARLVRERTSRYPCFSVCTSLPALVPLYGQTVWVVFFFLYIGQRFGIFRGRVDNNGHLVKWHFMALVIICLMTSKWLCDYLHIVNYLVNYSLT